ncbi:hypothetical protein [Algoriphagus aquimarinus]|uniref:hypothetical protein n=1 Tax=Algoriphagus aquimarinus TaxID=237018 RepID=UPI0030DA55EE|tara:strand:- start:46221 stop:46484 length:264 start_codon:yes stop_codon:yes gene_type:complete
MEQNIKKVGDNTRIAHVGGSTFVMGDTPMNTLDSWVRMSKNVDWESDPAFINGVRIVPHGAKNELPTQIRDIMDQNNLATCNLLQES